MAPTLLQLGRKGRKKKIRRNKVSCLCRKPQKRVLVYKIGILPPRKPNSAKRKHAKVRILGEKFSGRRTFAHIPG
jgi:small subunit ribosomal protein S12